MAMSMSMLGYMFGLVAGLVAGPIWKSDLRRSWFQPGPDCGGGLCLSKDASGGFIKSERARHSLFGPLNIVWSGRL